MTDVAQPPQQTPKKGRAASAGWICFVLGMVLMFVSLGTFFLYGPLFLAAFVLSIVAMTQGRVAGGIVLLLCTAAIPTVTWFGLLAVNVGEAINEADREKKAALATIDFEDVSAHIDGNYMYCEGKVRNNGTTSVDYVKAGVEWLDDDGVVLDTDWTYAVSGASLRPGGAKSFRIMTQVDRRMEKFRYFVMDD
jgi:hypothetical protein